MQLRNPHVQELIRKYPRNHYWTEVDKKKKAVYHEYRYGTAGFRANHEVLSSVMLRMGLLAALRSYKMKGQAIGIMVTASHNIEDDNGIKIVDYNGEMLEESWEGIATQLANCEENKVIEYCEELLNKIDKENENEIKNKLINNFNYFINKIVQESKILIGRDTRPHSMKFASIIVEILQNISSEKYNIVVKDYGQITTPQLHYLVGRCNSNMIPFPKLTSQTYVDDVLNAFQRLLHLIVGGDDITHLKMGELIIDCANGVGGIPLEYIANKLSYIIDINLIHIPNNVNKVNDECGAEHCHKKKTLPKGLQFNKNENSNINNNDNDDKNNNDENNNQLKEYITDKRMASVDGDCDRLIYYTVNKNGEFCLLDGDKLMCLILAFVVPFIQQTQCDLTIGVIQTAYANGASTQYIKDKFKITPVFTPTGVKYLHHEAKKYDISIYYEANGHGALLMSENCVYKLTDKLSNNNEINKAIEILLLIRQISNQYVGDAVSSLLLVEAALLTLQWNMSHWCSMYNEYPSSLTTLKVKNRYIFKTTNAETICVEPKGVQDMIDESCSKYTNARAFVRPSGTEDVVRIYTEASNVQDCEKLNLLIRRGVYDLAGGVGSKP